MSYGGYQQPCGWAPPQPPRRGQTGLVVAIVGSVVVLLTGFAVTGFVEPGFLLADDEPSSGGSRPETSAAGGNAALALGCPDGLDSHDLGNIDESIRRDANLRFNGEPSETNTFVDVQLTGTADGAADIDGSMGTYTDDSDNQCVLDFSPVFWSSQ